VFNSSVGRGTVARVMCGLYSFRKSPEEVKALFGYPEQPNFPPRDHVAPGQPIAIVRGERENRHFALVRWGFVPSWTKEMKPGKPLINARSETVFEKPSFRHAIRRRRCLIPADGFYEWKGDVPGKKQPFHITRPGEELFAFGGIWEHWMAPDGSELESAAILTTAPNAMMEPIHNRMPVIIEPKDFSKWLDHSRPDGKDIVDLMRPIRDEYLVARETEMPRPQRRKPEAAEKPKPQPRADDQLKLF
jgi:putative SOS response-associated peptidase YedK